MLSSEWAESDARRENFTLLMDRQLHGGTVVPINNTNSEVHWEPQGTQAPLKMSSFSLEDATAIVNVLAPSHAACKSKLEEHLKKLGVDHPVSPYLARTLDNTMDYVTLAHLVLPDFAMSRNLSK